MQVMRWLIRLGWLVDSGDAWDLQELERDILHERTLAGLAAARAQGRTGGRPTVMDSDKLAAAQARRAKGETPTQIAAALNVSRASVYRHLAHANEAAAAHTE